MPMSHAREIFADGRLKLRYQWGDHWLETFNHHIDMGELYGGQWADLQGRQPSSQFVAHVSPVEVAPWGRLGAAEMGQDEVVER